MSNNNKEWSEWWGVMRNLSLERRNRALTNRCRECGKGRLDGVNVEKICYENICEKCESHNN